MAESKSPLDILLARVGRLLEETAGSDVAGRVQRTVQDSLESFRLVPKKEFEEHLAELRDLQAQVGELTRRVQALERESD